MKKIIVKYENKKQRQLLPRDVRNLIGAMVEEEYKDTFMWHEHTFAPFLYQMPSKNSFAIYTYRDDVQKEIEHVVGKLATSREFRLKGVTFKITDVFVRDGYPIALKEGMYKYTTVSPVIISVTQKNGIEDIAKSGDIEKQSEFLTQSLSDCLRKQILDWHGVEVGLEDMEIIITDSDIFPYPYLQSDGTKKWYTAFKGTFLSNTMLPEIVGYKIGLGYGSIKHIKLDDNKKKGGKKWIYKA